MITVKKFEGLVAAPFTPMLENGELNSDLIPVYYKFLEKNGITGAFINGSTGEGVSLTQDEKKENISRWGECLKTGGEMRVICLVGGTSYKECIEIALSSQEAGLSAIAVLGPYYFKPAEAGQLAEFVAKVGNAVPEMPVYYYHIPVLTGVNMPMIGFLEKISSMLPNFAGIKYTHEDFMDFLSCLNYKKGAYDILWGRDENLLSSLVLGCRGGVGSTYNYAAPLYNKLITAYNAGDLSEARILQQKSVDMIRLLGKYGGISTGKAFMKYIGLDCGEFRLPVKNMPGERFAEFRKDVESLNMEELFSVR